MARRVYENASRRPDKTDYGKEIQALASRPIKGMNIERNPQGQLVSVSFDDEGLTAQEISDIESYLTGKGLSSTTG